MLMRVLGVVSCIVRDEDLLALPILLVTLRRPAQLPEGDVSVKSLLALFS